MFNGFRAYAVAIFGFAVNGLMISHVIPVIYHDIVNQFLVGLGFTGLATLRSSIKK